MNTNTIVNLRGTNGCGKSYLADMLIGSCRSEIHTHYRTQYHYLPRINTYVFHCDFIDTQEEVALLVDRTSKLGNVVFEGVLISTLYGRWLDFSRTHGGMIWCFLDTPVSVCLQRIQGRNKSTAINEDLVHNKWKQNQRIIRHVKRDNERYVILDHRDPFPAFAKLLTDRKLIPGSGIKVRNTLL